MMRGALALVALAGACVAPVALGQAYPAKPVRIINPYAAGGGMDFLIRPIAQKMGESMKGTFVIDNRAGANGMIGMELMAKAAPDGYTLLMHNITFPMSSVSQTLAGRSPFNVDTDFAGVSISVYVPFVFTASPTVPAKDMRELAQLLRTQKLNYNYGSTGPGSAMHVLGEAFKKEAKVEMEHIPFKGAAPLKQELLAGRFQIGGDQLSSSLAEIKAGTLKALATTASKRIPSLPDVPTVRELGFPGLELEGWNGLFVPAKTPREVIDRLQRESAAAVRHPDVVKRLAELGAEAVGSNGAAQEEMLKRQMDQFRPVIKDMKID